MVAVAGKVSVVSLLNRLTWTGLSAARLISKLQTALLLFCKTEGTQLNDLKPFWGTRLIAVVRVVLCRCAVIVAFPLEATLWVTARKVAVEDPAGIPITCGT